MNKNELILLIIIANIILLVFIISILAFLYQYRKKKKEHDKEKVNITETHNQELLKTQLEIQNQTMQHIGREIHDSVGQKLTLASLYAQQLHYENPLPAVQERIESISHIINEALDDLRGLSKNLTDDTIADKNISTLISEVCQKVNNANKYKVHFETNSLQKDLGYKTKTIIFRVAQEFLQNSIKHSQCENIKVIIKFAPQLFTILLKDDGIGFDGNIIEAKGIGLENIKKRLVAIGGNYQFESTPKQGTMLQIKLPIN